MFNFRPILLINGMLILILGVAMLLPVLIDWIYGDGVWEPFLISAFICFFVGGTLYLANQGYHDDMSLRQTFLFTTLSWLFLPLFAALPLYLSLPDLSYTDAYFEATSGLTTTGSTVLKGLDTMAHAILFWRALIQGLGAVGVIVLAMAVLPFLGVGGMQLFRTESSDKNDKVVPRAQQLAAVIGVTYLSLVALCAMAYWLAGMSAFDAICHAITTLGTAGFSNYDRSIAYFNSALIEVIATLGMAAGGIPIILYFYMIKGKRGALWRDIQVRWFISLLVFCSLLVASWLFLHEGYSILDALRAASFNVVSVITTTGFATGDFAHWGSAATTIFFILLVVGGCTGSTSGGIKIFRFIVLYQIARAQLHQLIQPSGVFLPRYDQKPISLSVSSSVLVFFTLFAFCFMVLAIALSCFGLDFVTSMSAAAQALGNIGPGLGEIIGPTGNYALLPDGAIWLLSFAMIMGRLELFTVLVLFTAKFWRD